MRNEQQMAQLWTAKQELRRLISVKISNLSKTAVAEQSNRAVTALCNTTEYHAAKRICIYLSMERREVQTEYIVRDALSKGKKVFVPYIYKAIVPHGNGKPVSLMDMLGLSSFEDYEGLKKDKWGIPTLAKETTAKRQNCFGGVGLSFPQGAREFKLEEDERTKGLDLIVMPGVAFDRQLARLGHGKGFYDRFLQRMREAVNAEATMEMPSLIGLALQEQILPKEESVPTSEFDWKVDAVIAGSGERLSR